MNKYEKRSMQSYDKKAYNYDNSPEGRFTERFKTVLMKYIEVTDNAAIIDIACGNGRLLNMLAKRYNMQGYGIDISTSMVENAQRNNPKMTFYAAPCDNLPFDSHTFDIVTVCAAYHHFPDTNSFAHEAFRVLKNGGNLYVADIYYSAIIRTLLNPFIPFSKAGDIKFYSPKEMKRTFSSAGFKNITVDIDKHIQVVHAVK